MSEQLEVRAEILRLARLLGREAAEFEYLTEGVASHELRALRSQITDVLYDADTAVLGRIAACTKILPNGLTASIGERIFGPVLIARLAGLVDVDKAVEIASRLPDGFLADVAVELDPRRIGPVLARIPAARIGSIAQELLQRHEYVTMGAVVGHLPDQSVVETLTHADPATLLQIALVVEDKAATLPHLFELIGPERARAMFASAAALGVGDEAEELLRYLSEDQRSLVLGESAAA